MPGNHSIGRLVPTFVFMPGSNLIWIVKQRLHAKLKHRTLSYIRLLVVYSAGRSLHIPKKSLCLLHDRPQRSTALYTLRYVDRPWVPR